jgi:hypothetical protein
MGIAASVSAVVEAASAAIAAFSAYNSKRRHRPASQRYVNRRTNDRSTILARIWIASALCMTSRWLIQARAIELRRDPAVVEWKRQAPRCLCRQAFPLLQFPDWWTRKEH